MILVERVKDHEEAKEEILSIIEMMKHKHNLTKPEGFQTASIKEGAIRTESQITHADYYSEYFKSIWGAELYRKEVIEAIDPICKKYANLLDCSEVKYGSFWFHEYHEGDYFEWHNHQGSQFTGIYYLNLPDGMGTEFYNESHDIKEGDVVIFPAYKPHRSPKIESGIKTIIAWSMDIVFIQ